MKKVLLSTLIFGVVSANAIELELLSGDTRLACEAMLCLASPVQPAECSAALTRYFSINAKKWSQVVAKRKSFLDLCPVVASSDPEMYKYKNEILANLDGECSVTSLNNRIENKVIRVDKVCTNDGDGSGIQCRDVNVYGFRVNPELTNSCKLLSTSSYTDYNLKYTCDTKFYEKNEWQRGYELKEVSQDVYSALPLSQKEQGEKLAQISRYEYTQLPQNQRKQVGNQYYRVDIGYYQKSMISKNCWVNEK
ncbi:hypothetical protein LS70_008615 [Helicobacter sp. MIT 11-5569]|jgi:hypothetical protein|uniref:TrbM/KikA/MpfK family conjugal transfer protein n=1 Tax=Helicobacter TaxID=209 RepID=UPI00047C2BDF|nr:MULTISPECIES: TrbM/KikA/MpfK family conjugal transfer protein [Helicobacter]TLD80733.1 hypothetical protein LS70_008615 [Helicobacter sp. MIT 11-5569]